MKTTIYLTIALLLCACIDDGETPEPSTEVAAEVPTPEPGQFTAVITTEDQTLDFVSETAEASNFTSNDVTSLSVDAVQGQVRIGFSIPDIGENPVGQTFEFGTAAESQAFGFLSDLDFNDSESAEKGEVTITGFDPQNNTWSGEGSMILDEKRIDFRLAEVPVP